jgi:hypothetical protein
VAQPLEVEHGESGEDHQAKDRVDQLGMRDLDEDRHDAEDDERHQRPEAHPRERAQVTAGRVARSTESRDEQRGGPARLPERARVHAPVVGDHRRHGEPDQQAERGEQPDGQLDGLARSEPHADQDGEGGDEEDDAYAAPQVAPQPGAGREQRRGERDVAHGLREQGVRLASGGRPHLPIGTGLSHVLLPGSIPSTARS